MGTAQNFLICLQRMYNSFLVCVRGLVCFLFFIFFLFLTHNYLKRFGFFFSLKKKKKWKNWKTKIRKEDCTWPPVFSSQEPDVSLSGYANQLGLQNSSESPPAVFSAVPVRGTKKQTSGTHPSSWEGRIKQPLEQPRSACTGKGSFLRKTQSFNILSCLHKEALKKLSRGYMHTL